MVDPNPGRGMPLQLQRYWLAGKGAAKIRWGMPGDFNRCVRNLRKYFPKNPKGLCNILHTKALGAPPGKGHGDLAIIAGAGYDEAQALLASQPEFGPMWVGPLAPIGQITMEPFHKRQFEYGALSSRSLPMPLDWRKEKTDKGHSGSVTVGRILGLNIGPAPNGQDYLWGYGDWLNPDIIPEVIPARYLVQQGVAGASLDPGGELIGEINPDTGVAHMSKYVMGGATLVSISAFSDMRLIDGEYADDDDDGLYAVGYDDYDMDAEEDCGCGDALVAAVNTAGWRGLPLAPREAVFDNDDAVKRIQQWSGGDAKAIARMFMWRDQSLPETDITSYRLPYGDIISGKPTMVYHAIYAAAALLSGAHGGLPNIPDEEKGQLRGIISEIYPELASAFNDSSIRAPWDQPADIAAREQGGVTAAMGTPPVYPPKSCFENPKLTQKTPLTVDDWRVYGHLAAWNECHRDVSMKSCVLAPHSMRDYEPFHLGTVFTAEGDYVRVGKIVMDTRHAGINLGYRAAAIHYDDTGDEVAVVRAGEDEFGIWVAGALVPEADERKVAKLRRSPLSGDWRAVDGNLELTAALAVNVPAFPVFSMDGEDRLALVAAGTVIADPDTEFEELEEEFSVSDEEAQEDRAWELRAIVEDHANWDQWNRARKLAEFAAEQGQQVPTPGEDPLYGDQAVLARQMDTAAPYQVMEDTGAGTVPTPVA